MDDFSRASSLLEQGQLAEAEKLLRKILSLQPDHGPAQLALARLARNARHYDDAIARYSRAAQALPKSAAPLLELADLLEHRGRFDEAGAALRVALEVAPDNPRVHYALGLHYLGAGRHADAENELRETLRLDPGAGHAYAALARFIAFNKDNHETRAMREMLASGELEPALRMHLHYALGRIADEAGDFSEAFQHWQQANQQDLLRAEFSVREMTPFFESLLQTFDQSWRDSLPEPANGGLTPILIVGLPRTGSTLLEQMLAAHSEVATAGEVTYLGEDVVAALQKRSSKPYPQCCGQLSMEDARELGELYRQRLKRHDGDADYVIDKLPANFQSLGLLRQILPEAKVLHLRRDLMDVGLSVFSNHFQAPEPYFSDLREFAAYTRWYQRIMQHWQATLPGFVLDVDYEQLAADPRATLEGVLEFCGLDWQDRCLEYRQHAGHIATLSNVQVRQPLQQRSGRWRHYTEQLEPLRVALEETGLSGA